VKECIRIFFRLHHGDAPAAFGGRRALLPSLEDRLKNEGPHPMLPGVSPISIVDVYSGGPRFDHDCP
jgi:hypothetical protein